MIELVAFLIPLASIHMPYGGQNQFNPGLAAEFTVPELKLPRSLSFAVGAYENSYEKTTAFGQVVWTAYRAGDFRAGGSIGLGTGYDQPVVGGLFVSYGHVHVTFIPPSGGGRPAVAALALRIPVGG